MPIKNVTFNNRFLVNNPSLETYFFWCLFFQLFVFKHWKCFKVKTFTKENYHLIDWHLWHIGNFVFYSQSQHIFSNSHFHGIFSTDSVVKKLNIWCIERSIWPFYHSDFFQGVQFWAADSLFQKLLKSLTLAAWRNAESFLFAREYSIKNDLIEYQMSCQAKDDAHISLESRVGQKSQSTGHNTLHM